MTYVEKIKYYFSKVFGSTNPVENKPDPIEDNTNPPPVSAEGYILPKLSQFGMKNVWIPRAETYPEGIKTPTRGTFPKNYPEGIILHFTNGWSTPTRQSAINTLSAGVSDGYTYLVMDRDGKIYQGFSLDKWGYHSGTAHHRTYVGIEHCNIGRVSQRSNGLWGSAEMPNMKEYWKDEDIRKVKTKDNVKAGTYLKFTAAQEKSLVELILWLAVNSGMGIDFINNVLGHDETSPDRRDDPGGALSMTVPEFRAFLKGLYKQIK